MKEIFIHIGYPRTGTTTLQLHLFPNHPEINYLGREPRKKPYIKLIDLVCNLDNNSYDKDYEHLISLCKQFDLHKTKTNILSSEFIISYATHYNNGLDKDHTICRTLKRLSDLFKDINVKTNFFAIIRNQTTIIPSFYTAASPELKRSLEYNADQMIDYLNNNKKENFKINNFLNGFKYWEFYNNTLKIFNNNNKLRYFIFEDYNNEFPVHLSKYLNIDNKISLKLIKDKKENSSFSVINEHPYINPRGSIIFSKIKKHLKSPKKILESFDKKIFNLYFLVKNNLIKENLSSNDDKKHKKEFFNNQLNQLKENSNLIKKYYRNDNLKLLKDLKIKIDKFDYL